MSNGMPGIPQLGKDTKLVEQNFPQNTICE